MKTRVRDFSKGLVIGIMLCLMLSVGTVCYAAGIMAERLNTPLFVNGSLKEVSMYLIEGEEYVNLKDIAKAVDVGLLYNKYSKTIAIETEESFVKESAEKKEAAQNYEEKASYGTNFIKAEESDKNAYWNANNKASEPMGAAVLLRDAVLGKTSRMPLSNEEYVLADKAACAISQWPVYEVKRNSKGECSVLVKYPSSSTLAFEKMEKYIAGLTGLTEKELSEELGYYVCEKLKYNGNSYTAVSDILLGKGESSGNCMSYAQSYQFMCNVAGIPCILVHSSSHQWNEVYVDGRWYSVDLTGIDCDSLRERRVLREKEELYGRIFKETEPELTRLVKEILVPSTKKK